MITFKNQRELDAHIARVAAPMIKKEAMLMSKKMVYNATGFRVKKSSANAQSSLEMRPYRGSANAGVDSIKVNGARGAPENTEIPALTSLLNVLAGLNIVIDGTTA